MDKEQSKNKSYIIEISDLCNMLNIGKNTAYNLITSGQIEGFKIGNIWKIPITSVDKYIKARCDEANSKITHKQLLYELIK